MRRSLIALFLYVGVALFFAVYAVALFSGASVGTATMRGLIGLVAMGTLGLVAGAVSRPGRRTNDSE